MYTVEENELLEICREYETAAGAERTRIISEIMRVYYNENERKNIYNANTAILKEYEHTRRITFPDYESLRCRTIYASSRLTAYLDKETMALTVIETETQEPLSYKEIYIFGNETNLYKLIDAERESREPEYNSRVFLTRKPFYIYFSGMEHAFVLSMGDVSSLLFESRAVFFFGEDMLDSFLTDIYAALPSACVNFPEERIGAIRARRREAHEMLMNRLKGWYAENAETIKENILKGKPRILFATGSFHNPILERPLLNLLDYFNKNGYDAKMLEEKSLIHLNYSYPFYAQIYDYKPDVIFTSNFQRDDFDLPEEIFFISWTNEMNALIAQPRERTLLLIAAEKMGDCFSGIKKYYKEDEILKVPLFTSPRLFYRRELSGGELRKYSCDIAIMASSVSFDVSREMWLKPQLGRILEKNGLNAEITDKLTDVIKQTDEHLENLSYIEQEVCAVEDIKDIYRRFFGKGLEKHEYNEALIDDLSILWGWQQMSLAYRMAVIRWIIEAGFESVKLYGNSMYAVPMFAKYDAGPADITTIPKLYSGAKVTVGMSHAVNMTIKMFESVYCDCLYILNRIDERFNLEKLPPVFKENENIVFFNDRADLIEKLKYYLTHDKERAEMARKTKETALAHLSYDKYIDIIIERLKILAQRTG